MTTLPSPASGFFISQRIRLHYLDWGNHGAPILILVHGGHDHARSWDWTAAALRHRFHIITPDLRGHGESEWTNDGVYASPSFAYDLARLVDHIGADKVRLVGHSLGGAIVLRYTGLFPERVQQLVAIEGVANNPRSITERLEKPVHQRWRAWMEDQQALSAHPAKRYATFEDAYKRLRAANTSLSDAQALHLTRHAVRRNEDNSYSWKFDPALRTYLPIDITETERQQIWSRIDCPTLLMWGSASWAENPETGGQMQFFRRAQVQTYEGAGHWVHHDQFEKFRQSLEDFFKV